MFHEQLYVHFHDATFPEEISHLSFLWRAISCKRTSSATSICSKLNKAISRFITFPSNPVSSILERVLESFPLQSGMSKKIKCHSFFLNMITTFFANCFSISRIVSEVLNTFATRNFSPPSIFGPENLRGIYRAFFLAKKLRVHSFIFIAKRQLCLAILKNFTSYRICPACHSSGYFDNYIRWNFANCAKRRSAPLETERFTRESLWICKTTPSYQKISSPSPAGAMKIFLWIRYKRIFFFIARDISWKEIPLFLAPTVFHSGNQRASALALSRARKKETRRAAEIRYAKKAMGAIRLVIWYASLGGILQIACETRGA